MKRSMMMAVGLTITMTSAALAAEKDQVWLRNIKQAKALAGRKSKPLFVVFRCER